MNRERILTEKMNIEKIICFGLTKPQYGSDASSLKTTAAKFKEGWLFKRKKRWIGSATFADYIIIWARKTKRSK